MFNDDDESSAESLPVKVSEKPEAVTVEAPPPIVPRSALAGMLGSNRKTLRRKDMEAAAEIQHLEQSRFRDLLRCIQHMAQRDKTVQPLSFVLERMYDETPAVAVVASFSQRTGVPGELDHHQEVSKIMASSLRFGLVLQKVHKNSNEMHLVHGGFTSRLVPMTSQTGPIVLDAIKRSMSLGDIEEALVAVFGRHAILRHADLHPSASAAERTLGHTSALLRCQLHRVRSAELYGIQADTKLETFLLHCSLTLREKTNAARSFQSKALGWAAKHAVILPGDVPAEVLAYRAELEKVLFPVKPDSEAEMRRWFCWRYITNGDIRRTDRNLELSEFHGSKPDHSN